MVAYSIEAACTLCPADSTAWVIGGAEVYAQALALAVEAVVTEIEPDFDDYTFTPQLDALWREVRRASQISAAGLPFSFVTYQHF